MCSKPSASMPTTRLCPYRRRGKLAPDAYGPTFATINPLVAKPHRQPSTSTRQTAPPSIRTSIWPAIYAGLMQADAYAGYNQLYEPHRQPGPITEAACWAHARRKFFEIARIDKAPIAIEAIGRIDA